QFTLTQSAGTQTKLTQALPKGQPPSMHGGTHSPPTHRSPAGQTAPLSIFPSQSSSKPLQISTGVGPQVPQAFVCPARVHVLQPVAVHSCVPVPHGPVQPWLVPTAGPEHSDHPVTGSQVWVPGPHEPWQACVAPDWG